jgi:N-acetylneuraminate synthase
VTNTQLLERMGATGLPVLLSSGMSTLAELDAAVAMLRDSAPYAVLQCTSAYPVAPERVGLNLLEEFRERYGCPVGLSDHSGTIFASLAAAALGAEILELHVTLSRAMFGPDVPASLTPGELASVVTGVRYIEKARANPVAKDELAAELEPMRAMFGRSIVLRSALPSGTVLEKAHLAFKKPGTALAPDRVEAVLGRRLARDLPADHLLLEDDLA